MHTHTRAHTHMPGFIQTQILGGGATQCVSTVSWAGSLISMVNYTSQMLGGKPI